ncbi:MAG: undecaprenyl-diphosphate phosphatase [Solirubrobacteraceae bacterium]
MLTVAAQHHQDLITIFQAIVLGILQGATELFPISSLGHTVLFPSLFGWDNIVRWQSQPESPWLAFVVMLHVGSAIGLLIYFWRTWLDIIGGFFRTLARRSIKTPIERLAWLIIMATIPVGILGLVLEHPVRTALAKPLSASIFLVVNGFILAAGEHFRRRAEVRELARREGAKEDGGRRLDTLELREAAVIGTAQTSALIAGISRDGVVMSTGLARGLDHSDAARFAFLLATPPILAAGILKFGDLTGQIHGAVGPQAHNLRVASVVAAISAAITAIVTVHFLMRYFKTRTLWPFAIYCWVFGTAMIFYNL